MEARQLRHDPGDGYASWGCPLTLAATEETACWAAGACCCAGRPCNPAKAELWEKRLYAFGVSMICANIAVCIVINFCFNSVAKSRDVSWARYVGNFVASLLTNFTSDQMNGTAYCYAQALVSVILAGSSIVASVCFKFCLARSSEPSSCCTKRRCVPVALFGLAPLIFSTIMALWSDGRKIRVNEYGVWYIEDLPSDVPFYGLRRSHVTHQMCAVIGGSFLLFFQGGVQLYNGFRSWARISQAVESQTDSFSSGGSITSASLRIRSQMFWSAFGPTRSWSSLSSCLLAIAVLLFVLGLVTQKSAQGFVSSGEYCASLGMWIWATSRWIQCERASQA